MKCFNKLERNSGILVSIVQATSTGVRAFPKPPAPTNPLHAMILSFSLRIIQPRRSSVDVCEYKVRICGKTAPSVPLQWWAIYVICLSALQQYLQMAAYNLVIGICTVLLVYVHTGRCSCAYVYIL